MFPLARSVLSLAGRGVQRSVSRQAHHKAEPDFHDKYGNIILASGAVFCFSIWGYTPGGIFTKLRKRKTGDWLLWATSPVFLFRSLVITQTGICWNLSPVGRITPKEWKDQ